MNTKQLEYFIAVAENLNFTKAAEKFYISQTAISLQIKSLEETLKIKLFNRNNRKVTLTPEGALFYKEAVHILAHINNAINDISNISINSNMNLKIGFSKNFSSTSISTYIKNFINKFPNINISLIDGTRDTLYDQLYHKDLDFIFDLDLNSEYYNNFSYKLLNIEPLYLITNNEHYLSKKKQVSLLDLKDLNIISFHRNLYPNEFDKMITEFSNIGFFSKSIKTMFFY